MTTFHLKLYIKINQFECSDQMKVILFTFSSAKTILVFKIYLVYYAIDLVIARWPTTRTT